MVTELTELQQIRIDVEHSRDALATSVTRRDLPGHALLALRQAGEHIDQSLALIAEAQGVVRRAS